MTTVGLICLIAVIALNVLIVALGRGHAAHRERAIGQAVNVIVARRQAVAARGSRLDVVA